MKEIVVARYNEDLNWLSNIENCKISIYNKGSGDLGIKLPNVGRESHTYLYHIIKNYENLANYTVFCQGNPINHYEKFIENCNNFKEDSSLYFLCNSSKTYGIEEGPNSITHELHPCGLPIYYFFDLLFNKKMELNEKLEVYYGAQFIVSKENILNKPKSFYEFLIKFVSFEKNPIEGYIIERLWGYIFNNEIKISNKYMQF
jgi:hypothetical protein